MQAIRRKDVERDFLIAELITVQGEIKDALVSLCSLLTQMTQSGIAQSVPRTLNRKEVAALLHVKEGTIDNWVSKRQIPFRKANGATFFLVDEILEWTKTVIKK